MPKFALRTHGAMRGLRAAMLIALGFPGWVTAQTATIGVYADEAGTTCDFSDSYPRILVAHVVVTSEVLLTGVRFAAPRPACFSATYLRDESVVGLVIGDSQTGISIALGGCLLSPVHVLDIVYFTAGNTPACCAYTIVPDPLDNVLSAVDCNYVEFSVASAPATVNGDASCRCAINRAPDPPALPFPAHDSWEEPRALVLTWTASDPDGDSLVYDVYFGTEPDPPRVASGLASANWTVGPLPYQARFYWKVMASDGEAVPVEGPLWTFVTIGSNPVNGDMTGDGTLSPADALCALRAYVNGGVPTVGCLSDGWERRTDVDCNESITPGDGLCIFLNWLDESCLFCTELDWTPPATAGVPPRVTVSVHWEDARIITLTLAANAATPIDAFGLEVRFGGELRLIDVRPGRLTAAFDQLDYRLLEAGRLRVGGFDASSLSGRGVDELLVLEFESRVASPVETISIGAFVDDLAGAPDVTATLRATPSQVVLHQNKPNPFNPTTEIEFELPENGNGKRVRLAVYDLKGALVRTLLDATRPVGRHAVVWDGTNARGENVASGVYLYRLETPAGSWVRKMVLLK